MNWNADMKLLNKYCKCDMTHFTVEQRQNTYFYKHKGVEFYSMSQDWYDEFLTLNKDAQGVFLNVKWNLFMWIND